jgi:hypothetical protein
LVFNTIWRKKRERKALKLFQAVFTKCKKQHTHILHFSSAISKLQEEREREFEVIFFSLEKKKIIYALAFVF